jgi:monofunctional glycosyltransferase
MSWRFGRAERSGAAGEPVGVRVQAPEARASLGWRIAKIVVAVLVGYYVFCVLLLLGYRFVDPPATGVQIQRRVEALISGRDHAWEHSFVAFEELPPHVPRAVVAAEDGRFWEHYGFDWREMLVAGREAGGGRIRGASTVTQQLMKNLFGTTHPNPVRKIYDWTLTPAAELILGKRRILELYLNNVEWGPGIWGIDAGARHHYGTAATRLSRTQAAGLAALLPNPLRRTPANTGQYRAAILRRMDQRGW